MLRNKNILIGITGGIAAYKICELVRMFKKNDANVKVVLTPNAKEFVTELTMDTLAQDRVYIEQFNTTDKKPEHISLCDWADIFIIAPASANTIGKLANGIADNLLTSLACAFTGTTLIAPAMNTGMWENRFVQKNISALKNAGMHIVEPESGFLACGTCGKGRLASVEKVFNEAALLLYENQALKGKKILITAGGTRENLDPVRYIGNYSSGKMGKALADAAYNAGAEVTLITGPTALRRPAGIKIVEVTSADEMFDACMEASESAGVIVKAAAVGDYRPAERAEQKIKRGGKDTMTLELVQNRDIAAELGRRKRPGQLLVGFAAETQNVLENAQKKMAEKNLDMIVSNDVLAPGAGFAVDTNAVTIMARGAEPVRFSGTKDETASRILDSVSALAAGK